MLLIDNINYVKPPVEEFYKYFFTQKSKKIEPKAEPVNEEHLLMAMDTSIMATKLLRSRVIHFSPKEAAELLAGFAIEYEGELSLETFKNGVEELRKLNKEKQLFSDKLMDILEVFWEHFIPMYNDIVFIANRGEVDEKSEDYHQFWIDMASNESIKGERVYGRAALDKLFE